MPVNLSGISPPTGRGRWGSRWACPCRPMRDVAPWWNGLCDGHGRAGGPSFRAACRAGDLSPRRQAPPLPDCVSDRRKKDAPSRRSRHSPADAPLSPLIPPRRTGLAHAPGLLARLRSGAAPPSQRVGPSPAKRNLRNRPAASRKVCACRALRRNWGRGKRRSPPAGGLGSWTLRLRACARDSGPGLVARRACADIDLGTHARPLSS